MEFEDILKEIGGYGVYQKMLLIVFIIPAYILISGFRLGLLFMASTPDHWCYVPEIAQSNLSLNLQKQLIRPQGDSSCSTYDVNYTQIIDSGNLTVSPSWPTKECDMGWQYDTTNYDATTVTKWNLVCKDAHYNSLLLSMMFAGSVFGPPICGFLSDKLGRKRTFCCFLFVVAFSEIGSMLSPYFTLLLVFRALLTSVQNAIYSNGYVVLLELVNPDTRSWVNGLVTASFTIGLCLLPLVAWITRNWIKLSMVNASCALALTLYWKLLPESPRWLLSENRIEEAHAILVKISKMNGKSAHKNNQLMQKLKIIGEKIKKQKSHDKKHSPTELLKHTNLRRRLFLAVISWIGVSVNFYGLQVNVRNLSGNEFLNFFLVSVVEFPSLFVTWLLLERIGRRWTMVLGFSLSGIACLFPVILPSDIPKIDVIASLFAKLGMGSCFMTLYQQVPELFPTSLRCQGMAISQSIASAFTLLMPYLVNLKNNKDSFLVFCIISCVCGIFASCMPETLNKNLPQTVEDIEKFDKDFRWFHCCRSREGETSSEPKTDQNSSFPLATVPIHNNSLSLKDNLSKYSTEDLPVLIKLTPIKYNSIRSEASNETIK